MLRYGASSFNWRQATAQSPNFLSVGDGVCALAVETAAKTKTDAIR